MDPIHLLYCVLAFLKKSANWRVIPTLILIFCMALAWGPVRAQGSTLFRRAPPPENSVPVLTVTQEIIEKTEKVPFCWQTIVSDRERARQQYESQSWVVKYWQPVLGALLGGAVGFKFTGNYGLASQKWVYPTVAAGMVVGAIAGPGMVAGAYGLGTVAHHFWPTKLPLTIMLSMVGGILGDGLMKLLFPDSPPAHLLAPVQPGQYLPDQQFYLETTCMPRERVVYTEKPFRVTYHYKGEPRSALLKYYPGERLTLNETGRPVNEIPSTPVKPAVTVKDIMVPVTP